MSPFPVQNTSGPENSTSGHLGKRAHRPCYQKPWNGSWVYPYLPTLLSSTIICRYVSYISFMDAEGEMWYDLCESAS